MTVIPTDTPATLPDPDVIVVPGSENPLPALEDHTLLAWLRSAAPRCRWTVSVCSGASLYAAAGLLEGRVTTTHWGFRDSVRTLGAQVVGDRAAWDGSHISAAGISAGIDMALTLTERVYGRQLAEALQLVIEYDPRPPFDCGSLVKASAAVKRRARPMLLGDHPLQMARRVTTHIARTRLKRAERSRRERMPDVVEHTAGPLRSRSGVGVARYA